MTSRRDDPTPAPSHSRCPLSVASHELVHIHVSVCKYTSTSVPQWRFCSFLGTSLRQVPLLTSVPLPCYHHLYRGSNFERHKVNSARIVRRRWGKPRKSKGYGFVDAEARQQSLIGIASHLSSNRFAQNTLFHRNPYKTHTTIKVQRTFHWDTRLSHGGRVSKTKSEPDTPFGRDERAQLRRMLIFFLDASHVH